MKFIMIFTKTGEPWVEEKRFDLHMDHIPLAGQMIFFESDMYQVLTVRTDCVRRNNELVQDKTYCFVQLIKKGVNSMETDLYEKFDKAMDDYKKINGDNNA